MERKTLKLALEALELLTDTGQTFGALDYGDNAITAIKQALAKPAQEPAFWLNEQGQLKATRGDAERHSIGQKIIPLYTAPQRPWVGLTDDELANLWYKESLDWMEFAQAIEAKLKEKNNG